MRVFDKGKPNVKALVRKGDVDGLIKAANHTELISGPDGTTVDVGTPIREEALFALRDVAPDRGGDVFVTALGDSSDRVRTAAVVALYKRGTQNESPTRSRYCPPRAARRVLRL